MDAAAAPDEENEVELAGAVMKEAISRYLEAIYTTSEDDDDPFMLTNVVVICECEGPDGPWVDTLAFDAWGHCLPPWTTLGLLSHAQAGERQRSGGVADES